MSLGEILRFPQGTSKFFMPVFKSELSCFWCLHDILNNDAFGGDVNDLSGSSGPPVTRVLRFTQKIVSCEATAVKTVYPASAK